MSQGSKNKLTKPLAQYSHARRVGDLLFIAGQGCRDPETDIWAGVKFDAEGKVLAIDFQEQVIGVFRNLDAVLNAHNMTRHHIVDVQVFLTNMSDQFPSMNRLWNDFFEAVKTPPTRTTIAVKELPGLNLIEMKVIAAAGKEV